MAATYPANTFKESVDLTIEAANQIAQVVRGDGNTEIMVADGSTIPSVRKALLDNFFFKSPADWITGEKEDTFNQLRRFTDGSLWYAKSATKSTNIPMGSSPYDDDNWTIFPYPDTTGVPAGTYKSVTVDTKGRVTAGTNPTTLAGYGITDAQPLDADLTALAGLNTYGLVALTAAGTAASRTISVSGTGLSITNGGGLAGNPTITSNATSSNTASTLVARDASGNFSAGNITATSFNGGAAFTGTPTAPTAAVNTNTTQLATTAFVYNNRPISGTLTVSTAGTQFTLPSAIKVPLIIAIDGVLQEPTNSFTVSAGVITFTESVPVGSVIFALGYTG